MKPTTLSPFLVGHLQNAPPFIHSHNCTLQMLHQQRFFLAPHSQPQLHITNAHQQRFFLAPPHSQPQLHITNADQQRFFLAPPHSQCALATTLSCYNSIK